MPQPNDESPPLRIPVAGALRDCQNAQWRAGGFRQGPHIVPIGLATRQGYPPGPGSVASQRDDPGPDYRTGVASSFRQVRPSS
jgi:hypothetical protein